MNNQNSENSTLNTNTNPNANTLDFPPLPAKPSSRVVPDDDRPSGTRTKTYSRTINLPVEEQRRPALGEKLIPADIAQAVAKSAGVMVDMSSSNLTRTITMVVRGGDEQKVVEACRMLRARLAMPVKIQVEVPQKAVGAIVGKQGRMVKAIMQETGARITVVQHEQGEDEMAMVQVSIEGPGDACADAKQRILSIVDETVSQIVEQIELTPLSEFFICGPSHNRSVKKLQSEFENIKITLFPGKLILSGDVKLVKPAKEQLLERIEKLNREVKHISTQVPKYLHKYLVGTKGAVLHHIEDTTNCWVVIPQPQDPSDSITLHGFPTDLIAGLQLLMAKTEAFHEEPIMCPLVIRSYLLRKHHADVKAIESDNGVQLRQDASGFVAVGTKASGEAAKVALKKLIQNLGQLQFDTLSIKKDHVRHVIGRQGQGLKTLESDYSINVLVEDSDQDEMSLLILVGENVEMIVKAKEAVAAFVSQLDNEDSTEISVQEKYIPELVKNIKAIQELHPSYVISMPQKGKTALRIRGPKGVLFEDCVQSVTLKINQLQSYVDEHSFITTLIMSEKAKEKLSLRLLRSKLAFPSDLNAEVDNLSLVLKGRKVDVLLFEKKVQEYLSLLADQENITVKFKGPELVGKLIGKGGKNITSLHDQYPKVHIQFDRDQGEIQITGPSQSAKECAAELRNRVDDIVKNSNSQTIALPLPVVSRLLSSQAEELNFLQNTFNVRVSIDREPKADGMKMVKVEGQVEKIEECIDRLQQLILEEHEQVLYMTTEQSQLVQTTFSAYFRQLTSTLKNVRVYKNGRSIQIRGKSEFVNEAKETIEKFLSDLQDDTLLSVQVVCIDQQHHGAIIGKGGQTVKKLMHQFDVSIEISKESNEVTVAGRGVSACIEEIMKLTANQSL